METTTDRKLPIGIQSFTEIREGGYLYADKTGMVWRLVAKGKKYNYLSRPRRFGKSVLVDTLQAFLEGRKELFDGLKAAGLEKEWKSYPVIRLDMSGAGADALSIKSYLNNAFSVYEKRYNVHPRKEDTLPVRFYNIIKAAREETGLQVCVLIDEYDSPLQGSWMTAEHEACTAVYRAVFAILKMADPLEKLVFITGITKFTQISLFSVLNNLNNISFDAEYAAICGITKEELEENFKPEIERMAEANGWTAEETLKKLGDHYDGYHFSADNMTDIFNPFSLISALDSTKLRNYWAASGATSLLPKFVSDIEIKLKDFERCPVDGDILETSDVADGGAELFLYQSGYLTIKDYTDGVYLVGIPNYEVRKALYMMVIPALTMSRDGNVISTQNALMYALKTGNVAEAMKCLKALIADVPYSNKKLASMNMEERYRLIVSTVLNAVGCRVEVERMLSTGRIDIMAETSAYIYVMELKLSNNGGIAAAEKQITGNRYTEPFKADGRKVIALAVELDSEGKGMTNWKEVTA